MNVDVLSVRGLRPEFGKVDRDLWLWFCEAKKDSENYHGPRVTKRLVQAKAKQAFQAAGILNFKASDGWYIRWLKRWHRVGLNNTKRLNNESDSSRKQSSDAQVTRKQTVRKSRSKTANGPNLKGRYLKSASDETHELGSDIHSQSNFLGGSNHIGSIIFTCSGKNILSEPLDIETGNSVEPSSAPGSSCSRAAVPVDALHDSFSSSSLFGGAFMSKSGHVQSEKHESGLIQDQFPSATTSSLLNLDDLAWNDISEISYFDRLVPPKMSQVLDIPNEEQCCGSKTSSPTFKAVQKSPMKGKGKLSASQKSALTGGPTLSINLDTTNANVENRQSSRGSSYLLNSSQLSINSTNHLIPKSRDKFAHDNYSDYDETTSTTFAQHDLEDVSVSSDFVNQLNDEHSLELNLECGQENLYQQMTRKTTLNAKCCQESIAVQHSRNDFVSLAPSHLLGKNVSVNIGPSAEIGCPLIVTENDLSSEENDYISEAVMLSMQEDDFSILNCDQSPFQGSISVVDENSQTECDRICDLDREVAASKCNMDKHPDNVLTASKNYDTMGQKQLYFSEVSIHAERGMETLSTSLQNFNILGGGNVNHMQHSDKMVQEPERYFMTSPTANCESLAPEAVYLTPLSNMKDTSPREEDNLQLSPVSSGIENHGQVSSISDGFVTHQVFDSSSQLEADGVSKSKNVFEISDSIDKISFVDGQNLIQISSSGDAGVLVTEPDTFLTGCSSEGDLSSLSSTYFSGEKLTEDSQSYLLSGSCSPVDSISGTPNMFFVPFGQAETENNNVTHFDGLNIISNKGGPSSIACSIGMQPDDSKINSYHEAKIPNGNSVGVPQTYYEDNSTKPVLSSLNNCGLKNSSFFPSSLKPQGNSTNETEILKSMPKHSLENQVGLSTISPSQEFSKENEKTVCNVKLAKIASNKQTGGSGNLQRGTKKNVTSLTEKSKSNAEAEGNQTVYRRSSGDRYFPYFKERVANYAIKHTAKEAAKYFGVNVDTVTMWTRGRHENDSAVRNQPDHLMLRWLKKNRESGVILSREQIVEKAVQLLKVPGNWVKDKSRWFHVWASRLADEEKKKRITTDCKELNSLPVDCGEKKALYPDDFKVEVVLYAEQTSKNLASTTFNIARKRVFEWTAAFKVSRDRDKDQSSVATEAGCNSPSLMTSDCPLYNKKINTSMEVPAPLSGSGTMKLKLNGKGMGRAVTSVAVDQELWLWFCEQTSKKSKPKSKDIRAKAVELFRAHNHDKIQCSHGWLKKWSMRYGIALRHEGDSDLLAWCLEQFDRNRNISHRELLAHAQESLTGTHKSEFKASAGWLVRFCKRHRNLLSTKPSIDVDIPAALKPNVSEFRSRIQNFIHSSKIPLANIGCVDELPFNFTAGGSRSRLLLRRSGLENCYATVILSCLANGELLPPAVIFKGDGPMEHVSYNGVPIVLFYQTDCSMTAPIMVQWLECVWNKNVSAPTILIADCYDPHCTEIVKEKCSESNISLHLIPAGCSFKLQPLDLAISRLFEANIYSRWTRHFSSSDQSLTCKRTSYSSNSDIARWVAEVYNSLKQTQKEAMCRSFLVTGLTSAPNGMEDHIIEDASNLLYSALSP